MFRFRRRQEVKKFCEEISSEPLVSPKVPPRKATTAEIWEAAGKIHAPSIDQAYQMAYDTTLHLETKGSSAIVFGLEDYLARMTKAELDAWNMGVNDALGDSGSDIMRDDEDLA
jgi:hypothetical protein